MKYLEIIPDFLSKHGVCTSKNTSQVGQGMSRLELKKIYKGCRDLAKVMFVHVYMPCRLYITFFSLPLYVFNG